MKANLWPKAKHNKLLYWDLVGDILWGEVESGGSGNIYTPWVNLHDQKAACGCMFSTLAPGRLCSHLVTLLDRLPRPAMVQFIESLIVVERQEIEPRTEPVIHRDGEEALTSVTTP